MKTFRRQEVHTHCKGVAWPEFLGRVDLGESFVIETVFCSDTNLLEGTTGPEYVDVVREACRAMREVAAARIGGTIEQANPIVTTALDIRNCAMYGLGNYVQKSGKTPLFDQLFASPISTFFALDLIITAIVFMVFAHQESQKWEMGNWWAYIVATLTVGPSFALPLFLYFREQRLEVVGAESRDQAA